MKSGGSLRIFKLAGLLAMVVNTFASGGHESREGAFSTSDGNRIHYEICGDGDWLIWVPGWTFSGPVWQQQVAAFAHSHRNVIVDPRGQGRSEAMRSGDLFERRAKDLYELLEHLDAECAIVVGWSLGAEEVAYMASDLGAERVAALILVDSDLTQKHRSSSEANVQRAESFRINRDRITKDFVLASFDSTPNPELFKKLVGDSLKADIEIATTLMKRPLINLGKRLKTLTIPILYVGAERNAHFAESLRVVAPSIETVLLEDVGHGLFIEAPGPFNQVVKSFLLSLEK